MAENKSTKKQDAKDQSSKNAMEARVAACLKKYDRERCDEKRYQKLSKEEIAEIHRNAKANKWPSVLIAFAEFGCSDNYVNKVFAKNDLEPLNVRTAKRNESKNVWERIADIEEQIGVLSEKKKDLAKLAQNEIDAVRTELAEKEAMLKKSIVQ